MIRMTAMLILGSIAPNPTITDCVVVDGPVVRAADLQARLSGLARIPSDRILFPSPAVGVKRWLSLSDVHSFGVQSLDGSLCIERASDRLDEEKMRTAMAASLGEDATVVSIVDYSRYPVARGVLNFPRNGLILSQDPTGGQPVLWRGKIVAADKSSTPIWARVVLRSERECLVASRRIERGEAIQTHDLARGRKPFSHPSRCESDERVLVGKLARQKIGQGEILQVSRLRSSYDVERGDLVEIVISSGPVELKIIALAESSASIGGSVWLREPTSGKKLRGRVTASKRVVIEVKDVGNSKNWREESRPRNASTDNGR